MARVGFYSGSFNPPHLGHMIAMLVSLETVEMDWLCVAPVFQHPDGKELAPFEDRLKMLRLATERHLLNDVVISRCEASAFQMYGTGHTADTLQYLLDTGDNDGFGEQDTIVLIMGSDLKASFPTWVGHDRIQAMVKAGRVEISWQERTTPYSSTLVRAAIKHGLSTRRLLPLRVKQYIREKGLYL